MNSLDFGGVLVPLVTPFTDDMSSVSEVRLARLVRRVMEDKPAGLVLGSEMGEFMLMTISERKQAVEIVLRETSNMVPVIVNCTMLATMSSLDLAQHARRHGARASIIMPPYFGQFTDAELQQHFKTIANYSDGMLILVDPKNKLSGELRTFLEHHSGIKFARPMSAVAKPEYCITEFSNTHEFVMEQVSVSPLALFQYAEAVGIVAGQDGFVKSALLAKTMHEHGVTRIAKGLLEQYDFEVGPPRTPIQPVEIQKVHELYKSLQ